MNVRFGAKSSSHHDFVCSWTSLTILATLWICITLKLLEMPVVFCLSSGSDSNQKQYYNYFAYGSNMASATMTSLRKLNPVASNAAVLPNYKLVFTIPGTPLVEPSWAAVEPTSNCGEDDAVHGVLYRLDEDDFVKVCQSEGVPFAYRLQRCSVIPYVGTRKDTGNNNQDDNDAGAQAMTDNTTRKIRAVTLISANMKSPSKNKNTPPSQSYLNVLIRGAKEYNLDDAYVEKLKAIQCGKTIIGDGIAETLLKIAEATTP